MFLYIFFFFWLHQVVEACGIFYSGAQSLRCGARAFSLVVALGLLSSCGVQVFSSLVVARGLCSLWHVGSLIEAANSVVVARGFSCPAACGILVPHPGIEPASPALEGGFFNTGPPGKYLFLYKFYSFYFIYLFYF